MAENAAKGKSSTWPSGEPKKVREASEAQRAREAYETGKKRK
ncbi:hypothetical protein ACFY4C_42330 [Actinomadura viridis]